VTKLFAIGFFALAMASDATAQIATVELVAGAVATSGTEENRTFRFLKEGDRLVSGTRIHPGNNARIVLIQVREMPGPHGSKKYCVVWTFVAGVERYTVRTRPASRDCVASPANMRLPDSSTAPPFVQRVTYVEFSHDKADFAEPPMLTRLRAAADTMRVIGQSPDEDLSVSYDLEEAASLSIIGVVKNTSARFYPCVRMLFRLLREGADGQMVQFGTASVTLRRIRGHETRTYRKPLTSDAAISLASTGVC
jgi:hypothetical protein